MFVLKIVFICCAYLYIIPVLYVYQYEKTNHRWANKQSEYRSLKIQIFVTLSISWVDKIFFVAFDGFRG